MYFELPFTEIRTNRTKLYSIPIIEIKTTLNILYKMDRQTDGWMDGRTKNNLQNLKCKIEVNTNKTRLFF